MMGLHIWYKSQCPTAITLTNGVSFSLVEGACCFVLFTNALANTDHTDRYLTLNINSTGAKNLAYYKDGSNHWTNYDHSTSAAYRMSAENYSFFVYTGSFYAYTGTYSFSYTDGSDW